MSIVTKSTTINGLKVQIGQHKGECAYWFKVESNNPSRSIYSTESLALRAAKRFIASRIIL